jgi:CheY-like chemotaxis protein
MTPLQPADAPSAVLGERRLDVIGAEMRREVLRAGSVHALSMEVMMPDMDGNEGTRGVRQDPRSWRLPVLALAADPEASVS